MRIYLGSDHAGFELKNHLVARLRELGHEPVDCGPAEYVATDDYPPYVMAAAKSAVDDPGTLAVVIGGSGNGEVMAADKVPGTRAALVWSEETATLARQHNDANVISVGARMHSIEDATRFVEIFVATPFSQDPRHIRRLNMLAAYEKTGELPKPE
jgi:ribose 5-phosphate isomerase B